MRAQRVIESIQILAILNRNISYLAEGPLGWLAGFLW
jgi:hypothetical protein